MRLSRIEIENFKGIGERQAIDIKPITLLFGPNSAGKSTVIQALHYAREILANGNFNPARTIAGGNSLGDFRTLIHRHNLELPITMRLEFEHDSWAMDGVLLRQQWGPESDFDCPDWWPHEIELLEHHLPMWGVLSELQLKSFGIEFEIRWSWSESAPYLSRFTPFLNGEPTASMEGQADHAAWITNFNYQHPLFRPAAFDEDRAWVQPIEGASPLEYAFDELGLNRTSGGADLPTNHVVHLHESFPYAFFLKPSLEELYLVEALEEADADKHQLARLIERFLGEIFIDTARLAREYLDGVCHIGALRDVPTRTYRLEHSPLRSSWFKGQAAWDLLLSDSDTDLTTTVNRWLTNRLDIPYRVDVLTEKRVPTPSPLDAALKQGLADIDLDALQREYARLPVQRLLLLRDLQTLVPVALNEVGIGLSQVLPIIVAFSQKAADIVIVEQPELHLHPAVQVGLGDLLIEGVIAKTNLWRPSHSDRTTGRSAPHAERTTAIIETHSEHLILRLLRRIRETHDGELPPGIVGLVSDQLSVMYAESTERGVKYRQLRVDDQGEFLDRWPEGFFEERIEELL